MSGSQVPLPGFTGDFYRAGSGEDFYGVWDKKTDELVARFEPSPQGWQQTWDELQRLEKTRMMRRFRTSPLWIFFHLVFALFVAPLLGVLISFAVTGVPDGNAQEPGFAYLVFWVTGVIGYIFAMLLPKKSRWIGITIWVLGIMAGLIMAAVAKNQGIPDYSGQS